MTRGETRLLSSPSTPQIENSGLKQVRGMHFGELDNGFLVASGLIVNGGAMVFEGGVQGAEFVQVPGNKDIPNFTLNVTS